MLVLEIVGGLNAYNEAVVGQLAKHDIHPGPPPPGSVAVVIIHCDAPERWERLSVLAADPECVAVAVLPTLEISGYIQALSLGASGVIYLDTPSPIIADIVLSAVQGEVVLPRQAAQHLAILAQREEPQSDLRTDETYLLRAVATGRTIAEIASDLHYSERTVRRNLQSVYIKLGVKNRTAAIATAVRLGLAETD